MSGFLQRRVVETNDDAGRIQVIVEGLGFSEELRSEDDVRDHHLHLAVGKALSVAELLAYMSSITHRNGGLDHHHGIGVHLQHQLNDLLHVSGVEEVLLGIIVGGSSNNHNVRILVGCFSVQRSHQIQRLFGQKFFDVIVLNGRNLLVDLLHFLGNHVHGHYLVLLRQKGGNAQAYIAGTGNCNFHFILVFVLSIFLFVPLYGQSGRD